jgi:general stress protein 26
MVSKEHASRIKAELRAAGATQYALMHAESKYLPQLIHEDEHIGGVVYGRIEGEFSMLVATNKRVLFLQRMALFTTTDEVNYNVVSGVKSNDVGLFSSVTLHTRISDYSIRFANTKCVHKFVKFIEDQSVENNPDLAPITSVNAKSNTAQRVIQDQAGLNFLAENDLAVLSTISRTGVVNGAVVYYTMDSDGFVYILTRSESTKARGVIAHGQVALTVHEPGTLKTAQVQGMARVETDQSIREDIFNKIIKPRPYQGESHMPPVTKLKNGSYMVIKITPTSIRYNDYTKHG